MEKNISKFVGVLGTDKKCYLTYDDEDFYLTHLDSYGASIPVAMSEYFFELYKGKRVCLLAFPRISRKKIDGVRQIFSYLSCVQVSETTEPRDLRYVKIEGQVVSETQLKLSKDNLSQLDFEMECAVRFKNEVKFKVPCRAFEKDARSLLTVKKDDILRISGYVAGYGETLRVIVRDYEKEEKEHA